MQPERDLSRKYLPRKLVNHGFGMRYTLKQTVMLKASLFPLTKIELETNDITYYQNIK